MPNFQIKIIRSDDELAAARDRAQAATFKAEDAGDTDEGASAVYELFQWMTGNSDTDPTAEMGEDEEDDEG
jgi:hypothetical protein